MAIQGFKTDADFTQYRERPENWRQGILLLNPNGMAPLYALTAMMKEESTDDPVFHWFEEELPAYRVEMNEDLDNTETEITLVSGATYFKEGDILRVEDSDELIMVTANPVSDTSITVQREFAGTAAEASISIASENPYLMLIGSAYEEGSDAPEGRTFGSDEKSNQCQIFRDSLEITETARNTKFRTGDQVKEDKRRCLDRHSIGIERAMIFGKSSTTTKNGKPRRTMNGVIQQLPAANIFTPAASSAEMDEIEEWLRQIFLYGSSEKIGFCGSRFMLGVQQACRKNSNYQLAPMSKEFGMNVQRLTSPGGVLVLKTHPQFNQMTSPAALGYLALDTWCLVIDGAKIKYRYLSGRDTKYQTDQQDKGVDGLKAGYISECGIQLTHAKTHFLIKGVAGGKVDT